MNIQETLFDKESMQSIISNFMINDFYAVGNVKEYKVFLCHRKEVVEFIKNWHYSKNVNGLTTDYCFKLLELWICV